MMFDLYYVDTYVAVGHGAKVPESWILVGTVHRLSDIEYYLTCDSTEPPSTRYVQRKGNSYFVESSPDVVGCEMVAQCRSWAEASRMITKLRRLA